MLASARDKALDWYYAVRTAYPVWYNVLNREAVQLHHDHELPLSDEGKRIVEDLKKNGVAVSSLDALFPGENLLQVFQEWERAHPPVEHTTGKKQFLRQYWDLWPVLDFDNPFLRFSLDERILSIGHHYMGMWLRMRQYLLAKTIPEEGLTPVQSQKWHRDPEEKKWFKCFVYLNDVDETAGPFTYALQSNWDGVYRDVGPQKPRGASYPPESEVEGKIPKENVRVMTGKAGSVIFCDVAGLHYGGRATHKPRIMFTACYNAPSFSEGSHFRWDDKAREFVSSLSPSTQYAVGGRTLTHKTGSMMG